jgi:hypothetical protein
MLPFLALSFDAAAHQAVISVSLQQELPEAILCGLSLFLCTSLILFSWYSTTMCSFDHFVWKFTCLFISDQNLLSLEGCQITDAFVNIPRYKLFIAAMDFCIGLLDEGYPQLVGLLACSKDWLLAFDIDGKPIVHDDVNPSKVFEESEHIQTSQSEAMEDGRIYSH